MDCIAIKDIRGGMKNINVIFIILDNINCSKTKENREVNSFKVADPTASINCSIWDEPGKLLQPGDIVKLTKGYVALFRGALTLYSGKSGEILKMGDFCMVFNEQINMSEPIKHEPTPSIPPPIQGNHINANNPSNGGNNNSRQPVVQAAPVQPIAATNSTTSNSSSSKPTKTTTPPSKPYIRKPISKK